MRSGKYCLLIENDPEDQEFFLDALHQVSSTTGCYAAADAEEALLILIGEDFFPDYVFMDLNMPGIDGFEFLKIFRSFEKFKDTPVIIYSLGYTEEQIQKARTFGVTAIYSKSRMGVLKQILKKYFSEVNDRQAIL